MALDFSLQKKCAMFSPIKGEKVSKKGSFWWMGILENGEKAKQVWLLDCFKILAEFFAMTKSNLG